MSFSFIILFAIILVWIFYIYKMCYHCVYCNLCSLPSEVKWSVHYYKLVLTLFWRSSTLCPFFSCFHVYWGNLTHQQATSSLRLENRLLRFTAVLSAFLVQQRHPVAVWGFTLNVQRHKWITAMLLQRMLLLGTAWLKCLIWNVIYHTQRVLCVCDCIEMYFPYSLCISPTAIMMMHDVLT